MAFEPHAIKNQEVRMFKGMVLWVAIAAMLPLAAVPQISGEEVQVEWGEGCFEGYGGVEIYYQYWRPDEPIASMVLVHGFGEHSGRYDYMGRYFAGLGLASYALDHRGHGKSGGPRWNPGDFDYYIYDLKSFVEMVKELEEDERVFMLGHSLGGTISLKYAMTHCGDLKALVVSGPGLGTYFELPVIGRIALPMLMIRIMAPLLGLVAKFLPNMGMPGTQIDPQYLNHDPDNYNAYADDPLVCHEPMKMRFSAETSEALLWIQDNPKKLRVPTLFLAGSEDILVPPDCVRDFYEKVTIEDKGFIIYDGFYHEIFNEMGKEVVYRDATEWLSPRL